MPRDLPISVVDAATHALYPHVPLGVTYPATRRRVEAALSEAFRELSQGDAQPAESPVERSGGAGGHSGRGGVVTDELRGLA